MKKLVEAGHICTAKIVNKNVDGLGMKVTWKCGKPAIYAQGNGYFCRHHSGLGRYVIRYGDVGNIIQRFDSENEALIVFDQYSGTGIELQKVSKSKRRTIKSK